VRAGRQLATLHGWYCHGIDDEGFISGALPPLRGLKLLYPDLLGFNGFRIPSRRGCIGLRA
jgi:hypothetical protein